MNIYNQQSKEYTNLDQIEIDAINNNKVFCTGHGELVGGVPVSQVEIDAINEGRQIAAQVAAWVKKVQSLELIDQSAVTLGKVDLQQGFMWVIRGITQPTLF